MLQIRWMRMLETTDLSLYLCPPCPFIYVPRLTAASPAWLSLSVWFRGSVWRGFRSPVAHYQTWALQPEIRIFDGT